MARSGTVTVKWDDATSEVEVEQLGLRLGKPEARFDLEDVARVNPVKKNRFLVELVRMLIETTLACRSSLPWKCCIS